MQATVNFQCIFCRCSSSNGTSWCRMSPVLVDNLWRCRGVKVCVTRCQVRATSNQRKPEDEYGWVVKNQETVRSLPLYTGGASLVAVLLNRAFSGIASIADASSAQSRADVLALALSATVVLTGLVWKSIEAKPQLPVALYGVECMRVASFLPADVVRELMWAWESLETATSTRTMVVVYGNVCILQAGLAAVTEDQRGPEPVDANRVLQGSLYKALRDSKKHITFSGGDMREKLWLPNPSVAKNYLANLPLYPGRFELPFLPSNTQALILQPLGEDGVLILGSDTLRGFGPNDQKWVLAIGEKLDSALADTI